MTDRLIEVFTEADAANDPGIEMRYSTAQTLQQAAGNTGLSHLVNVGQSYTANLFSDAPNFGTRQYAKVDVQGTDTEKKTLFRTALHLMREQV